MHDLDFLISGNHSQKFTYNISKPEKLSELHSSGFFVHEFKAGDCEFCLPDISVGWFLTMARDPDNFFENFFTEYNDELPDGIRKNEDYITKILEILFANLGNKTQAETGEHNPSDLVLSIAMIVKHLGLSYGDILQLPLADFYTIAENSWAILGQEPLPETSQSKHADGTALMALKNFMSSAK